MQVIEMVDKITFKNHQNLEELLKEVVERVGRLVFLMIESYIDKAERHTGSLNVFRFKDMKLNKYESGSENRTTGLREQINRIFEIIQIVGKEEKIAKY